MLVLYDFGNATGPNLTQTDDSSLIGGAWDDRASSARVVGGCQWVVYVREASSQSRQSSVIGPGPRTYLDGNFGRQVPDNSISSVRRLPASGPPVIVLYQHTEYYGNFLVLNSSHANLAMTGFDNEVSSSIITGGTWQLYHDVNYQGQSDVLGVGDYVDFNSLGVSNDAVSSVRLVGKTNVLIMHE